MNEYVWYAGYGSNLDKYRFYYYINGGEYKVTGRNHPGCLDKTLPLKDSIYTINYELYFAEKSKTWENKAVAFIADSPNKDFATKCMLYLVTREQFIDILMQENGYTPSIPRIVPDFEAVKAKEKVMIGKKDQFNWYGQLIYLGEHENFPIYTFTAKWSCENVIEAEPGADYLRVIGTGLINNFEMTQKETASYLLNLRGVAGSKWTIEDIIKLLNKSP